MYSPGSTRSAAPIAVVPLSRNASFAIDRLARTTVTVVASLSDTLPSSCAVAVSVTFAVEPAATLPTVYVTVIVVVDVALIVAVALPPFTDTIVTAAPLETPDRLNVRLAFAPFVTSNVIEYAGAPLLGRRFTPATARVTVTPPAIGGVTVDVAASVIAGVRTDAAVSCSVLLRPPRPAATEYTTVTVTL